jgi:hypothetical protein
MIAVQAAMPSSGAASLLAQACHSAESGWLPCAAAIGAAARKATGRTGIKR